MKDNTLQHIHLMSCHVSDPSSVSTGSTIIQPPEVLLGGVPASFVAPLFLEFATFRGCLHDFTYNISEGSPVLIDPVDSTDSQYVISTSVLLYLVHTLCSTLKIIGYTKSEKFIMR